MGRSIEKLRNIGLAAAIAALGFAGQAVASPIFTVSESGDTFSFQWQQTVAMASDSACVSDGLCATGDPLVLSGRLDFTVNEFNDGSVVFNVTATHLTDLSAAGQVADWSQYNAYFNAFGFVSDPSVTGATLADGTYFTGASTTSNFPGFSIDVCAHTRSNSRNPCTAAGPSGIPDGGLSDSFVLTLFGDFSGGSLTLSDWVARHTGDLGSYQFRVTTSVSEPASLALLGFGVLGAALARRRRKS